MSDDRARPPTDVEDAMAANATSRRHQGRRDDQASRNQAIERSDRGGEEQSFGQMEQTIRSAFDRNPRQDNSQINETAEVKAAKERSAQLLREAADLLAERTNDS